MNILFFVNDKVDFQSGVGKKISSQSSALSRLADKYEFIFTHKNLTCRVTSYGEIITEKFIFSHLVLRYRFGKLLHYILSGDFHLVYIRYTHFASPGFLNFLSKLKENGVLVVLEFPTFPYDSEYSSLGFLSKTKLLLDRVFRQKLKKYVDYAITFTGNDTYIFGIETLCISNAVDKLAIENRYHLLGDIKCCDLSNYEKVIFSTVSSMHHWHGIDRFIRSLHAYFKESENNTGVIFNIIGDGPELKDLKELVEHLKLSDCIFFHGYLTGESLDSVLLSTNIGVDSLGRFRSGNYANNSLKSKEYLSFGIPVLKSHCDESIDDSGFVFNVANDDSIFSISDILTWYDDLFKTHDKSSINRFCYSKFTWDAQFSELIERLSHVEKK